MTKITYEMKHGHYKMTAEGHAGYNPGNDIVCASISTLVKTLWIGLERECDATGQAEEKDGYFRFCAMVGKEHQKQADTLMKTVVYGLKLIEKGFPNNIEVEKA